MWSYLEMAHKAEHSIYYSSVIYVLEMRHLGLRLLRQYIELK